MPVAIADARAKEKDHVIEQRAIAIRRVAQFFQILGKQLDVMPLNAGAFFHLHRVVLVVRDGMVRLRARQSADRAVPVCSRPYMNVITRVRSD